MQLCWSLSKNGKANQTGVGHNICLRIVILIITLFSHLLSKSFLTFQTEEEEGVVSFDEVSAPQSVVGDEATCS